jgi:hypothetical protein
VTVTPAAVALVQSHTLIMEGSPQDAAGHVTANVPFPAGLGPPEDYALLAEQIVRNQT